MIAPRKTLSPRFRSAASAGVVVLVGLVLLAASCREEPPPSAPPVTEEQEEVYKMQRLDMVRRQIEARGVRDPLVLDALRTVERHKYVPDGERDMAYADHPLPIGYDQTISQPYIVGLMTSLLEPKPTDKVLEVGTGSGYQAAVLAELVAEVYTIEIIEPLGRHAAQVLEAEGYENVHVRIGDGYGGWPEEAPFDGIIVTAAPESVPAPLKEQLAVGGRLVIPVGASYDQRLRVFIKTESGLEARDSIPVRFVPMTGEAQRGSH